MSCDATVWDTFAVTKKRFGDHGRIASADWPVLDWHEIYNWADRSRRELASKNPQIRQLIVQVWYPTEDRSGPASPYEGPTGCKTNVERAVSSRAAVARLARYTLRVHLIR